MRYPDGEEHLSEFDKTYYRGMKNGMTDLILAAREADEPLSFDLLERITEGALTAVMGYMVHGSEHCAVCGAPIPEGRQICIICERGN